MMELKYFMSFINRLIFGNIALYMACRKRQQQRYYSSGTTTHILPTASAPVCIDDVDHSVTFVSKKRAKKSSSNTMKGKYLSPLTNTSRYSLEPALEKRSRDNISSLHKEKNCFSSQCCGDTGRQSPPSDIEGGRNKSYTYAINPESPHKGVHAGTSKSAGTIIISNPQDQRYYQLRN